MHINFIKEHKEETIGSVIVIAVMAVEECMNFSNKIDLQSEIEDCYYPDEEYISNLDNTVEEILPNERLVIVNQFIRNLPIGCKDSLEKVALAEELGEYQTLVDEHKRKYSR